ncbi:MAG: hypothetical protein ACE5LB_05620 [Acidiferrobacterales bacterium]
MKKLGTLLVLVTSLAVLTVTYSGHEMPIYPSYYPQEIRIEPVDSQAAGQLLLAGKIHAYVGDEPTFVATVPKSIGYAKSLGSYVVLTLNRSSALIRNRDSRCDMLHTLVQALSGAKEEDFVFHPYPVSPFHADYLHHADLADAAKKRYLERTADAGAGIPAGLKVRAKGAIATKLVAPHWSQGTTQWDASVEEINVAGLVVSQLYHTNGWLGPPWVKQGWFHAYLLLRPVLRDATARQRADAYASRLRTGDYENMEEKFNLERELVSLLTRDCQRAVLGHTLKREYFNTDFSAGIENIAFDSITGFNSPIFIRTVKLKDFPWNGWLRLGVSTKPSAAWNPMAGLTDEAGRLIWFALGDPAVFPEPYDTSWTINRIGDVQSSIGQ